MFSHSEIFCLNRLYKLIAKYFFIQVWSLDLIKSAFKARSYCAVKQRTVNSLVSFIEFTRVIKR